MYPYNLNMAPIPIRRKSISCSISLISVLLLCSVLLQNGFCTERPTIKDIEEWAGDIDEAVMKMNYVYDIVNNIYEHKTNPKESSSGLDISMLYKDVNELDLVEEMAKTLSDILSRKMEALKKSVDEAEIAARKYPWKKDIQISDVNYYNSKTMIKPKDQEESGRKMAYSERFGKNVNFNFSSVHIPVEIYEGSNDILNGLNWTSALDKQFIENYNNDPDILWQYFGSQSGFMRSYPATNWNIDGVDLYDVRRQSWYTQGSSSPKDMMILIDTSGSTFGQSLQLMKNAVKSILNTLGENDFVNVVEFSETAKFVSRCFNHTAFVQANFRNKKQLEKDVDKLSALGQADFTVAIKFAFEKFEEFAQNETNDENNIGANCNKVIMLLTDGGTDNAEEVFAEHNWPNKTVRVFTYAVGPTPNPIHAVRWMACANRGYFSQIPAMGAIRSRVQDYVRVLERPLAIDSAEHALWTSSHRSIYYASDQWLAYTEHLKETMAQSSPKHIYWELTFDPREYIPVLSRPQVIKNEKSFEWGNIYEDHLGLGMMTTVTLPVYNNSAQSTNQTILGVMGVDVTTAQLEDHTPFSKIGPNGYAFAINPNGYVVFHPNLKTLGKFMKEPPNIDLLELEVEVENSELPKLRTEMIKEGAMKKQMIIDSLYRMSPDQRYVSEGQATYAFIPIENTTFRLGISVPMYQKNYPSFNGDVDLFKWPDTNSHFAILIAPWNYHKEMSKKKDLTGTLHDIIDQLKEDKKNPPKEDHWNHDMLCHLYWDLSLTASNKTVTDLLMTDDTENTANDTDSDMKVKAVFIMANGGMTLVHPAREADYFMKMRDLRKSSLYTRTLYSPSCVLMADHITAPRSNTSDPPPYINIACPISVRQKNTYRQKVVIDKPAVAGIRVSHDHLMSKIQASIEKITDRQNKERVSKERDFPGLMTCKDTSLLCYFLDDGGFLIATNRDDAREQVGRFFGLVDPPIMTALNDNIFASTVQYDFQAACKQEEDTFSAGFKSITIPTLNLVSEVLTTGFWTSKIACWLFSPTIEVMAQSVGKDKECVKAIQQYYLKKGDLPYEKSFSCSNCTRQFTAVQLHKMNLIFIVSDPLCEECDDLFSPIDQAPREITPSEEEEIICQLAQNPRKRFKAYDCYASDKDEDPTECGCAGLRASWSSLVFTIVLVIWRWNVSTS